MRESEQPEQMAPTDAGKSNRKRYTIIQMGKQIEKKKKWNTIPERWNRRPKV